LARVTVMPVIFALEGPRRSRDDVVDGVQWWKAVQATTVR
jgi:hypothetical protein